MSHTFNPKEMKRLESPRRRKAMPPRRTLKAIGLKKGDIVLDIGCGTGYLALPASRLVGKEGFVYGFDRSRMMLAYLRKRARDRHNIELFGLRGYDAKIKKNMVDCALMVFVLHELEKKSRFLKKVERALRTGGRLAVIDWRKESSRFGPPVRERISKEAAKRMLRQSGFKRLREIKVNKAFYGLLAFKGALRF